MEQNQLVFLIDLEQERWLVESLTSALAFPRFRNVHTENLVFLRLTDADERTLVVASSMEFA